MRKIPSSGTPIFFSEIIKPLFMGIEGDFAKALKKYFHIADVFVTGSGTCALYLILEALKRIYPDKKTVILPAYTAPVLKLSLRAFTRSEMKGVLRSLDIQKGVAYHPIPSWWWVNLPVYLVEIKKGVQGKRI